MNPRDADPLTLPETAGRLPRKRRRPARLSRGEQAVAGAIVFLAVYAIGLFTAGMADAWIYVGGIGVGVVLDQVHRWAAGTDA